MLQNYCESHKDAHLHHIINTELSNIIIALYSNPSPMHPYYSPIIYQGLIEPPKAARGHVTSNADSVDCEM